MALDDIFRALEEQADKEIEQRGKQMVIDVLPGSYSGKVLVDMPAKPYMALRARRID